MTFIARDQKGVPARVSRLGGPLTGHHGMSGISNASDATGFEIGPLELDLVKGQGR